MPIISFSFLSLTSQHHKKKSNLCQVSFHRQVKSQLSFNHIFIAKKNIMERSSRSSGHYQHPIPVATIQNHENRTERVVRTEFEDLDDIEARMSSVDGKKRFCTSKTTLILLVIIIGLLCLIALIIGIYSLVLTVTRNANETRVFYAVTAIDTVIQVTTTIATPLVCISKPTTSYQYSTSTPPECLNYTVDSDPTRNIGYTSSINSCDNVSPFNNVTPIWFRFQDAAGTLILNDPVGPNRCGAVATGWYAGQYPAAVFSTARSLVCYSQNTNTCGACNLISITNCRTFFVFSLPQPPACDYRYCTL